MISRLSELLILLKRNACSLQFIITFHFTEQMSTNKSSHILVIVPSLGFNHEIMLFTGTSLKIT